LTGRLPRAGELPRFDDHHRNLFTLLASRYRVVAFDRSTSLCPPRLCSEADRSFGAELWDLAEDAGVLYLHVVLPAGLARRLPSVTERWAGFVGESSDEPVQFDRFLEGLGPSRRPELHYGHFLLPHSPWQYLPSGERYDLRPPGLLWGPDEVWTTDEGLVVQSLQRHLLQTAYVDALLGRLVARLRSTGLYDRSLLVVVADHGISFRPGGKRRPVSPANIEDIAFVPLLVKRPGQRRGRILERHVRTVDVVPTIVDVIGIRSPWPFDGRSPYSGGVRPGRVVVRKDRGDEVSLPLLDAVRRRRAALARRVALFGSRTPPSALFGIGRYRSLLGRPVTPGVTSAGRVELDFVQRPGAGLVAVGGRVTPGVENVAVVVSGRVAAVFPVFGRRFWALVPGGDDRFRLVAVDGPPRAPRVTRLTFRLP
jgi:hypothetical protein